MDSPNLTRRQGPSLPVLATGGILLLALAGLLAGGAAGQGAGSVKDAAEAPGMPLVTPGPAPDLVVLFTGRVIGYVEPCGCPKNPAGGLPRRVAYLDILAREYPEARRILVETGDFAAEFNEAGLIKTRTYVDALADLEYDVVGIGERELSGGLESFNEIFEGRSLDLISASFTRRGDSEPFLKPFVVKEYRIPGAESVRIGFLGLSRHNSVFASAAGDGKAVVSRDPVAQARAWVPRVAGESDIVILLANMGPSDLRRVASAVTGQVDLVLASFGDRLSSAGLERIGGIPTLYAGDQGRRLGEIRLFLDGKKIRELKAHYVHLTERYPAQPRYQKTVDRMLIRVNEILKTEPEAGPDPGSEQGGSQEGFLTSVGCAGCHETEQRVWENSRHAQAMQTLVDANQDFNPECVRCHNTGFGLPGGFRTAHSSPELVNVQCEACHGSAADHIKDTASPYGGVPPRTCYRCHTRENSPDFSFFKYWTRIRH